MHSGGKLLSSFDRRRLAMKQLILLRVLPLAQRVFRVLDADATPVGRLQDGTLRWHVDMHYVKYATCQPFLQVQWIAWHNSHKQVHVGSAVVAVAAVPAVPAANRWPQPSYAPEAGCAQPWRC